MIDKQSELHASFFGSSAQNSMYAESSVKETLLQLMKEGGELPKSWAHLRNVLTFKSMLVERDAALLRGMRRGFRAGFKQIFNELNEASDTSNIVNKQKKLSECLSLLPFAGVIPDDVYDIPEWDDGAKKWNLVKYRVQAIELTPTRGPGALILKDYQRLFAYGLEPDCGETIFQAKPQPHLIFMNTLYPPNQSLCSQLFADLEWFAKPGSLLSSAGKAGVGQWLSKSTAKAGVTKARIHAVSDKNWHLLANGESFVEDFDVHAQSCQHAWSNFAAYLILRRVLFGLFALGNCLVIPVCRAILEHKTELLIIGVMALTFITLPGLLANPLAIFAVVSASLYIGSKFIEPMRTLFSLNDEKPAAFHAPDTTEMYQSMSAA